MRYQLGFLGAGNMAEAIAKAAVSEKVLTARQMIAADISEPRRQVFATMGLSVVHDNADVIRQSQQVLVAVKPQVLAQVAKDLAAYARADQVIISIMAGVTTARLTDAIRAAGGKACKIVRIMPNTPLQVGYGMAGICLGRCAAKGDEALAMKLFGAAGEAILVDESKMDAITAVSGSGPAYVFYLAEAMQRAAEELGLGEHAELLVRQTLLGAAHLLAESGEPAVALRRHVTSPGGTTEAAVSVLDKGKAPALFIKAIQAAAKRSAELGK